MLLRLRSDPTGQHRDAVLALARRLGYESRFLDAEETLLRLDGEGRPEDVTLFGDLTGVRDVLDAGSALELHERGPGRPDTVVRVGAAAFGGGRTAIAAGPCAVEDWPRLLEIARAVRAAGATLLRGGAYKPRTSPYSFQGLGEEGLELLARARAETGLAIVTEVLDPRDVERVAAVADMLQVGARSMTNAPLLREVGRAGRPVLLKRGVAATLREFVLAAEYVLAEGNAAVVLCERGVRGFDKVTRNLLDVGAVAHLARATHLPVVVDPSHAAGRADLVRPLARAGLAAGAAGLIVEVHPAPGEVRSDGTQAVSLDEFRAIAEDAERLATALGRRLSKPDGTYAVA